MSIKTNEDYIEMLKNNGLANVEGVSAIDPLNPNLEVTFENLESGKIATWLMIPDLAAYKHDKINDELFYVVRWDGKTPSPSGEYFSIIREWNISTVRTVSTI